MATLSAEPALGWYLRNALHSEASAELLTPIADAVSASLAAAPSVKDDGAGANTAPPATAAALGCVLAAFADLPPFGSESFERNARFGAAEFALARPNSTSCCLRSASAGGATSPASATRHR